MAKLKPENPKHDPKILIVGGYGHVGQEMARILAPAFPDRLVLAGRNAASASRAAHEIGHGSTGRQVDIFKPDAEMVLEGVGLLVMCLDQESPDFAIACLKRGIDYVDISARLAFLEKLETLDGMAKKNGARAILSVGLAPGLTNMLARRAARQNPDSARIDILLELGLGDQHGKAAIEWMLDNLDGQFEVMEAGQPKPVRSFGEARALLLPGQKKPRKAWRFAFPDQKIAARLPGVTSISTWIRFDSAIMTRLYALLARSGFAGLMRRSPRLRQSMVWLLSKVRVGSDICGVAVNVSASAPGMTPVVLGVIGRGEAMMTATVAAETIRQLLQGDTAAGVIHSDAVTDLDLVLAALQKTQPDMVVQL